MELLLDKINQVAEELKLQYGETAESVPDWAIVEKLNEPIVTTKTVYQRVKTRDIKTILILSQELFNIDDGVSNGDSKAIKSLCFSVITVLNESELELDFNNPEYLSSFQQIVVNLFASELISEATKERLESLIVPEIQQVFGESWAQLNQLEVTDRIVGLARGGVG